jgi:hypothetical protein
MEKWIMGLHKYSYDTRILLVFIWEVFLLISIAIVMLYFTVLFARYVK